MLVTYSGLDGAGKTTQIELFTKYLIENNYNFKKLSMFDDISVSAYLRKGLTAQHKELIFDNTTKKTYRYDKNNKNSRIVFIRKLAYLIDLLTFIIKNFYYHSCCKKILIMDRYLYDSLANLNKTNSDKYLKFMLKLIPKPDLSILLDVEPSTAYNRKPEYPPQFYVERREAYLEIFRNNSCGVIINSDGISKTQNRIQEEFMKTLAGSKITADDFSPYVDLILKTLLNDNGDQNLPGKFNYNYLLKTLQKNRITTRWINRTKTLLKNDFKKNMESVLTDETNRLNKTIELTAKVFKEFEKKRLKLLVIKTLDNYPDLGHDVDMFTDAPIPEIDDIFLNILKAKLETPSLPEKIAHKRNYKVDDFATFELHCSKLGELGEETLLAKNLISNHEKVHVKGFDFCVPRPEYRLLICVLQRIYRHFNIRICDIYNTIAMIQNNQIDWKYLKKISIQYGLWEGVLMYLSYVNKIALSYGVELNIKQYLGNKNWPDCIIDKNMHFRFPLLSTGINVYSRKIFSDIYHLNINSLSRIPLFIPLAVAHFISVKIYGKSNVW